MRKALLFFSVCSLMFAACSGDDSEPTNNNNGGGDEITVPIEFDFTGVAVPNNATSIDLNGIEVKTGNTYNMGNWIDCAEPNNAVLENVTFNDEESAIAIGTGNYNTLIADVSNLPAIQKVIITMATYTQTRISLCNGNEVIAESLTESADGLTTVTLNVGGFTADRLYIGCLEGGLYSIRVE